jgi:hypothetical protein
MDGYLTAFDLSQSGYSHWGLLLVGLAFGIWGWFVLSILKIIQSRSRLERVLNPFQRSQISTEKHEVMKYMKEPNPTSLSSTWFPHVFIFFMSSCQNLAVSAGVGKTRPRP